jgi:hypothetical protein
VSSTAQMQAMTTGRLLAREMLAEKDLCHMYALLRRYFDGATPEQFRRDLEEKNWVVLLEKQNCLVGFSTLRVYETWWHGEICSVVCSGDTIVAPDAWNTSTLPRTWIGSVAGLRRRYPRGRYLWLLITSGFRTYRFLPLFWRQFFPRFDSETPAEWKLLIDLLAGERFGSQYDPATGVVRFQNPQILRAHLSHVPGGRQTDPHVAFFLSRNPGYIRGDELVCLTELSPDNLTPAGRRMAVQTPQW